MGRHSRSTTASIDKWAVEIASHPDRLRLCQEMIARLDPTDLDVWQHPLAGLWKPLEAAGAAGAVPAKKAFDRYRLERMLIVRGRALVQRSALLRRWLGTVRLGADVLLRE